MPAPDYVPQSPADDVRPGERLPVPDEWRNDRPSDIRTVHQPAGPLLGSAGPDQGYAVKLARHFKDRLQLAPHEHSEDAVAGCLAVGLKRASLFGRAPVIYDLELAYTLWGFLGSAPSDLVDFRVPLFEAASHHYEDQRRIADSVPEATLRLTPGQVSERIKDWRSLISVAAV